MILVKGEKDDLLSALNYAPIAYKKKEESNGYEMMMAPKCKLQINKYQGT